MTKLNDPPQGGSKVSGKRWQGRLIAALLILAGILHAVKPSWLSLDWPSIALILVGILLLFLPIDDLGSVVESLEIGKTKILFRNVENLHREVQRAIGSAHLDETVLRSDEMAKSVGSIEIQDGAGVTPNKDKPNAVENERSQDDLQRKANSSGLGFDDARIRALLDTDKEMALIQIGIEIERTIDNLLRKNGIAEPDRRFLFRRSIASLSTISEITPAMARALINFREVRNQIVHARQSVVPDSVLNSAIDSGLELLRYLAEKLS